jgi:hypothetical protein
MRSTDNKNPDRVNLAERAWGSPSRNGLCGHLAGYQAASGAGERLHFSNQRAVFGAHQVKHDL